MKNRLFTKLLLSIVAILVASPIFAADGHDHAAHAGDKPFYGHLDIRIHSNSIIDAEEEDEKFNETYSHSHLELGVQFNNGFSINSNIKLEGEPSGHDHGHGEGEGESEAGGDRFLEDHPLFISELTLNYDGDYFSSYIGKFNPAVGLDYHIFPGIFGYHIIEEYAIRERVGFGVAAKHNAGDYGTHRLEVSTFFADTTPLSNSLIYQRGHTSEKDGGLSNTEDFFSSFAISLSGHDFYSLNNNIVEGLFYRLGYAKQEAGTGNEDNETRYSFSLGYEQKITQDINMTLVAEHMDITHLGGEEAHDRAYSTLALRLDYQKWNLGASYTNIKNEAEEEDENHDGSILQISIGYNFDNGIALGLGYQSADQENEVTDTIGALLSYSYAF